MFEHRKAGTNNNAKKIVQTALSAGKLMPESSLCVWLAEKVSRDFCANHWACQLMPKLAYRAGSDGFFAPTAILDVKLKAAWCEPIVLKPFLQWTPFSTSCSSETETFSRAIETATFL